MGYPIGQASTAYPLCFLMVLTSDHITGATGLTPTVMIRKPGGAFAAPAGAVTEIANGWYQVAGNAADTSTLGPLLLHATSATADPSDDSFPVAVFQTGDSFARLGAPTNASVSADIAVLLDAGLEGLTVYPQGDVSAATLATSFTLSFDAAASVTAANLVGWHVDFGAQMIVPSIQAIATATQVDSTHVLVTFSTGFSATPTVGFIAVLSPPSSLLTDSSGRVTLAPAGLDAVTVETGLNARQALSVCAAESAGVLAGATGTSITFQGAGVATNRITATVDSNGNRTAVAINPP